MSTANLLPSDPFFATLLAISLPVISTCAGTQWMWQRIPSSCSFRRPPCSEDQVLVRSQCWLCHASDYSLVIAVNPDVCSDAWVVGCLFHLMFHGFGYFVQFCFRYFVLGSWVVAGLYCCDAILSTRTGSL